MAKPRMPTREEILQRAIAIYQEEQLKRGLPAITPTEAELKEGNYWNRARNELMSGVEEDLRSYLEQLEAETVKVREQLGETEPEEVEEKYDQLFQDYMKLTKEFTDTANELKAIKKELEEARKIPPPPPPPPVKEEENRIPANVIVSRSKPGDYTVEFQHKTAKMEEGEPRIIMFMSGVTIPEVEKEVAAHRDIYDASELLEYSEEEWFQTLPEEMKRDGIVVWTDDQVTWSQQAEEDRITYQTRYSRSYLEGLTVDQLREIAGVKNLSPAGRKENVIARILGEKELIVSEEKPKPVREEKPKPPPKEEEKPEKGLWPNDESRLRDLFIDRFLSSGVTTPDPHRFIESFRVSFRESRDLVKDLPHEMAFEDAKASLLAKADQIIAAIKPRMPAPPTPAPPVVQVGIPEERPREPTFETRTCWMQRHINFTHDVDLEMRLRRATFRGRFGVEVPILRFPELFYWLCPEHKMEKYGYYSMIDAVAFQLAEAQRSGYKKLDITEEKLRRIGLNDFDIDSIVMRAIDYGYKKGSELGSSTPEGP